MRRGATWLAAGVVVIGVATWAVMRARAGGPADVPTTVRQGIDLTIYSQDFAMVSEVRPLYLGAGTNTLHVDEVSRQLDPDTVMLGWAGGTGAPETVSHAYDLGVSDQSALLKRYLGRQVEVVRYGQNGREADRQAGTLMAESGGQVVLRTDGRFYVGPPGTIVAPARPDVVTIPQLTVTAQSPSAQKASLQVGYLTRGLSWSADYVAYLPPDAGKVDLECWATVTNRTGVDYPSARVALVAGSPNRAVVRAADREPLAEEARAYGGPAPAAPAAMDINGQWRDGHAKAELRQAGEGHAYRLKNPVTIVPEQMSRVLVVEAKGFPAKRDYNTALPYLSLWDDAYGWGTPAQPRRGTVGLSLVFYNREGDGLGMPLPHGAIRFYERDSGGALRYVGAAGLADTPKDARVDLTVAGSFDLYTEYRVVKRTKVDRHTVRKQVEVVVHNEKAGRVPVRVVQPFGGSCRIVEESRPHTAIDANNAQWIVPVAPGATATLRYTAELKG